MVFSNSLEEYTGTIENSFLRSSLLYLKNLCGENYKVLKFSEGRIAVPITLSINLPSRGNKDDLDIRSEEPVFFVFDLNNYPHTAPTVFTDRTDFPKDDIAHLFVAVNGWPPAICYVRGDLDDWYAEKRIEDLVARIRNWFREAATGELTENGDQFDPQRIEKASGTIVFDYDYITGQVLSNLDNNYLATVFEHSEDTKKTIGAQIFTFEKMLLTSTKDELLKLIKDELAKDINDKTKRTFTFGGIFWSNDQLASSKFKIDAPSTFGELKTYVSQFGISSEVFDVFLSNAPLIEKKIPIILAVKRTKELYGFSGKYEFLCFQLVAEAMLADGTAEINDNTIVKQLIHKQPLTSGSARKISGDESLRHPPVIVYGCGALGSKVVEHLSRSGFPPAILVDPDTLSPHNLVRHTLDSKSIGLNKASELAKKIRALFAPEQITMYARTMLSDNLLEKFEGLWLLDFTASTNFSNERIIKKAFKQRVIRTLISDSGNISYLLKEGKEGNPRIDDLETSLYYLSMKEDQISSWLFREQEIAKDGGAFLQVGVGCNSETTILADDTIALHSAMTSRILKREIGSPLDEGKVYFQAFNPQTLSLQSTSWNVSRFDVFQAKNDDRWNIRFAAEVIDRMRESMKSVGRNETGGILIGLANYKTMTIHVMDMMHLPDDSASPVHYIRESKGLPEKILEISERSGGQLGYVGEWHTHPVGPEHWSSIDKAEMERFKVEHAKMVTPLPVFMTVVTKTNIHPYVL